MRLFNVSVLGGLTMVFQDYYSDANASTLRRIGIIHQLPEFVKEANVENSDSTSELPINVFADRENRLYPCHTKVATWLAQTYFLDNKPSYSEKTAARIQERIDAAAGLWEIKDLCKEAIDRTVATLNPETLSDDQFALVFSKGAAA